MVATTESVTEEERGVSNRGVPRHRVIGKVIPGPTIEGTPRPDAGRRKREQRLTPPPLVQAEPYTSPPLVQAEPPYMSPPLGGTKPFDPLPWPMLDLLDNDQRAIANRTKALTRSAKKSSGGRQSAAGANLRSGTSSARLLEATLGPTSEIIAADPKNAGEFANPSLTREQRQFLVPEALPKTSSVAIFLLATNRRQLPEISRLGMEQPI